MPSIRIWTLESDNDAKAVKLLADKLATFHNLEDLFIRWSGEGARRAVKRKGLTGGDGLKAAVSNYLKEDACVILVIDTDSPMSTRQRLKEPNSLINQVLRVVDDREFKGKVFYAPAVNELEAWLLTDCLGVFCFFASRRTAFRENCREKVLSNSSHSSLVRKFQQGDTENIVEVELGGRGAKEYLKKFSEQVLRSINPKMRRRNVERESYRERMSPEVAEHVAVNNETLRRNNSLRKLGVLLSEHVQEQR